MQSIERYGVVALLFLIVTVAAVLMWGDEEDPVKNKIGSTIARPTTAPSDNVVASRTQARRDRGALTDEDALLRRKREAQMQAQRESEQQQERLGVSSGVASANSRGTQSSGGGIVQGGRSDERPGGWAPRNSERNTDSQGTAAWREREAHNEQEADELADAEGLRAERDRSRSRDESNLPRTRPERVPSVPVYVVKANEVLGVIAQQQLGSVKFMGDIVTLNPGLNPDRIKEGMKLRMPESWGRGDSKPLASANIATPVSESPRSSRAADLRETPEGMQAYEVKNGDSLWSIAQRRLGSGGRYREIEASNPGLGRVLKVGTTIYLPGTSLAQANPARTTVAAAARSSSNSGKSRGRVR